MSFPASWGHMHYANAKEGGGYPLMATTFVFDFVPEDFLQSSVRVKCHSDALEEGGQR